MLRRVLRWAWLVTAALILGTLLRYHLQAVVEWMRVGGADPPLAGG